MQSKFLLICILSALCGTAKAQDNAIPIETPMRAETKMADTPDPDIVIRTSLAGHFGDITGVLSQIEFGKRFSEAPLALTGGIGWSIGLMDKAESHSLRIPFGVDYLIGNTQGWNLDIYGGVAWNYLLVMSYNGDRYDLSEYDRTSWNGSFRIAAGHKDFYLFGQYDFSFQSGGGGAWYIGIGWQ